MIKSISNRENDNCKIWSRLNLVNGMERARTYSSPVFSNSERKGNNLFQSKEISYGPHNILKYNFCHLNILRT